MSADMRGNTDETWSRTLDWLVRNRLLELHWTDARNSHWNTAKEGLPVRCGQFWGFAEIVLARRPRSLRQLCFNAIACVEEFGFVGISPQEGYQGRR
jgi:hypothetical protein